MFRSTGRIIACVTLSTALGLITPGVAMAAGHGSHRGRAHVRASRVVHSRRSVSRHARRAVHGGPLSYNAYWKAATAPFPPRPNQDYNRYWQKFTAWQAYRHQS